MRIKIEIRKMKIKGNDGYSVTFEKEGGVWQQELISPKDYHGFRKGLEELASFLGIELEIKER